MDCGIRKDAHRSHSDSIQQGDFAVPHSVLEAIKSGIWDFEPEHQRQSQFPATKAMPGTTEKLAVLSARIQQGLPLWHPSDRRTFDDSERMPQ